MTARRLIRWTVVILGIALVLMVPVTLYQYVYLGIGQSEYVLGPAGLQYSESSTAFPQFVRLSMSPLGGPVVDPWQLYVRVPKLERMPMGSIHAMLPWWMLVLADAAIVFLTWAVTGPRRRLGAFPLSDPLSMEKKR